MKAALENKLLKPLNGWLFHFCLSQEQAEMDATNHLVASSEIFLVRWNKHLFNFVGYTHKYEFHCGYINYNLNFCTNSFKCIAISACSVAAFATCPIAEALASISAFIVSLFTEAC